MKKDTKQSIAARRQFEGEVVSAGMQKTIRVRVDRVKMHPKYRKQYRTTKAYPVHDEKGVAKPGNRVLFEECRPMSKTKRWRLITVLS
jgi:small subunit ribosomal protein S17